MGHGHGPWLVACESPRKSGGGPSLEAEIGWPFRGAPLQCYCSQGDICPLTALGGASLHCR